jgi:hypothetical protein
MADLRAQWTSFCNWRRLQIVLLGEFGYISGDAVIESKQVLVLFLLLWKVNCQDGLLQVA